MPLSGPSDSYPLDELCHILAQTACHPLNENDSRSSHENVELLPVGGACADSTAIPSNIAVYDISVVCNALAFSTACQIEKYLSSSYLSTQRKLWIASRNWN